ncbi:MAG: metallophosphoesterase family protein [Janthinobacterium lividum]
MVKYKVRAVFCGHNHIYWHKVVDGVNYFISGGGGAPLDATPENGGYLHYVTVQVDGTKLTTQVLQPEHLEEVYPDGETKIGATQRVWVTNTNFDAVILSHIVLHVAAPPAGQTLGVTAMLAYKKKNKPLDVQIISRTPGAQPGTVDVVVLATLPKARTAEITVGPGAK